MLSIVSTCKPFRGHFAVIQRNAITSWTLLKPRPEIILFGDEEGVAETCRELGLWHVPKVARNEFGTPLLNDIFEKAQELASHALLCYINADIITMSDFMRAVETVAPLKRCFLMVGHRWDLDLQELLTFEVNWEERLRSRAQREGQLHASTGIDYFVSLPGFWRGIPPFALGRPAWDNWCLFRARKMRVWLIDATAVVMAVHQKHDYSHHPQGKTGIWEGSEAQRNRKLAGEPQCLYTLQEATHRLTPKGIRPWLPGLLRLRLRRYEWRRHWREWIWHPWLSATCPVRYRLGLRQDTFQRWKARFPH